MSRSQPIADYGLLADCNGAALVDRAGSIDWLCFPRYDSPALFARILDPDGGHWALRPTGRFDSERRYLDGSLVLETTFSAPGGVVRLRDALAFAEGQRGHDLGFDAPHEVLRSVEALSGSVELEMELAPRPEYGLVAPLFRRTEDGGRTFGGPTQITVRADAPVEIEDATMRASFNLAKGERAGFAMRWAPLGPQVPEACAPERVAERIEDVAEGWRSWEADHDIYDYCTHREHVRFSSRLLKGLSYRPTGAIVAAPTTSLPEDVGGERNWDYRYAWIRDSSLTLEALWVGACPDEAEEFVSFMTSAAGGHAHGEPLQIMFGIGGEHDLSERVLSHLRGWRDSGPVRVGNAAWTQTQLDVYGEFLIALWLYRKRLGELHPEIQHFICDLADSAARAWRERDHGIWETRGEPQHHVSSKVLCWAALDRAVRLEPHLGEHAKVSDWAAERDRVHAAVLERGWSERHRSYAQAFDSDELDAAALLMPLVGFLPATDERMRSTIEAIARELTEDGLVLRYRTGEGLNPDGLRGEEGTFLICSFWLVSCLAQAGEIERAEELYERLAGCANDLGLLAEEVDPASGELLGNFPQALSHIGMIKAAWDIDRVRERPEEDPTEAALG